MTILSYAPTPSKMRSAVGLKDKLFLVWNLTVLLLVYPFNRTRLAGSLPLVKLTRDWRSRSAGVTFVLPGNVPPENTLLNRGYEPEVRAIVRGFRGGVFIDAGAGIGLYALMAAKNAKTVVALEPDSLAFKRLEAGVKENGLKNVKCYQMAAWSEPTTKTLYTHPLVMFQSSFSEDCEPRKYFDHSERVATTTIDSVMPEGSPVLIKLDVEGAEPEAMVGALKTLLRKDVTVIFEALSPEALARSRQIIEPLGYSITRLSKRDYLARRP